jgi:hypothetical protein
MSRLGRWPKRFWRPVIGIVVAYAVATQSLLIALGGFALAAHDSGTAPGFELCLHGGAAAAPTLPVNAPIRAPCSHCIFCFAGAHHAVIGSPPALNRNAHVEIVAAASPPSRFDLPHVADHSIANPRGPPPRA